MNTNIIKFKNVSKKYQINSVEFNALQNVNLTIRKGEFIAIVGKSGSGKSTLLNMISGIDRPTNGEVIVTDIPIHKINESKTAVWRGKNLGIVFQFFQLLPTLTILENVLLPMDFYNYLPFSERKDRAMKLLELVGIVQHANKFPDELSGGEQQRAAISRALANDPPIIIADEPTGNLDSQTANQILNIFSTLNQNGKTIVIVTHERDKINNLTRTVKLSDGEIVGSSNDIYSNSKEVVNA